MKSGTRPAEHLHKLKAFRFGAIAPADIPDFCVDKGGWWPDQDADNAPTECVGYKSADYMYDLIGEIFSPDFGYAAARYVNGDGPGIDGASFHAGVEGLVAVGALTAANAGNFKALIQGELSVSDFGAWSKDDRALALENAQNGVRNVLLSAFDPFDSIILAAYQTGKGISIGSQWYIDFNGAPGGIISGYKPSPSPLWHNYAIKGQKTIGGQKYAMVKWWNGLNGDHGWLYFDRVTVNALMDMSGAGALTIDPSANRWLTLLGILLRRFPALLPELPQLFKLSV